MYTMKIGNQTFELPPANTVADKVATWAIRSASDSTNQLADAALVFGMVEAANVPGLAKALNPLPVAETMQLVQDWMTASDDTGESSVSAS